MTAPEFRAYRRAATAAVSRMTQEEIQRRAREAGIAPLVCKEWHQQAAKECPRRVLGI